MLRRAGALTHLLEPHSWFFPVVSMKQLNFIKPHGQAEKDYQFTAVCTNDQSSRNPKHRLPRKPNHGPLSFFHGKGEAWAQDHSVKVQRRLPSTDRGSEKIKKKMAWSATSQVSVLM